VRTVRRLLTTAVLLTACGDASRHSSAASTASVLTDSCEATPGAAADDSTAEAAALRALAGWRRDGTTTLRYDAPRGASLALVDDSSDDGGYVRHELAGRVAGTEYAAVRRTYVEAEDYLLVHLPTGDTLGVRDRPLPSPDGRYAAAAKADLDAGFEDSGLEVIALTPEGPRVEFSRATSGAGSDVAWAPVNVRWVGSELHYGHAVAVDGAPGRCRVTPERLVRTPSGWVTRADGPLARASSAVR